MSNMQHDDMTCIAEGMVFPTEFSKIGINSNEIVIGPTRSGKTFSNAYSRMLHTYNSSLVVPVSKRAILEKFQGLFESRGYETLVMDFSRPEQSNIGYDPMDFLKTNMDAIALAKNLVCADTTSRSRNGDIDPYWNETATSVLAAMILLCKLRAEDKGRKASFADVLDLYRSMNVDSRGNVINTSIDVYFEAAESVHPGNQATELWKTIKGLATKTASCILSIVNNSMDKIFSEEVVTLLKTPKRISFEQLGRKKMVLFIITSPMNKTLQHLVNLMYADMFRELFESAEKNLDYRLDVPVHIICDDFACGKIADFSNYISIFAAAGISVTLLLQSESQLKSMYGEADAVTIINNCDTYVYLGGLDLETCRNVGQRINKPVATVMSLPLEQVLVFRRGMGGVQARRYQTMEDPLYKELFTHNEAADAR